MQLLYIVFAYGYSFMCLVTFRRFGTVVVTIFGFYVRGLVSENTLISLVSDCWSSVVFVIRKGRVHRQSISPACVVSNSSACDVLFDSRFYQHE